MTTNPIDSGSQYQEGVSNAARADKPSASRAMPAATALIHAASHRHPGTAKLTWAIPTTSRITGRMTQKTAFTTTATAIGSRSGPDGRDGGDHDGSTKAIAQIADPGKDQQATRAAQMSLSLPQAMSDCVAEAADGCTR